MAIVCDFCGRDGRDAGDMARSTWRQDALICLGCVAEILRAYPKLERNQPQQPAKDSVLPADGDLKETSKGVGFHDAKHELKGD